MNNNAHPEIVSATEVANYTYCPEAWRLDARGVTPSAFAQQRMRAGEREHRRWLIRQDLRDGYLPSPRWARRRRTRWAVRLLILAILAHLFWPYLRALWGLS